MEICKIQTDATGEKMLAHNEDCSVMFEVSSDNLRTIRRHIKMPKRLGKAYVLARLDETGYLALGGRVQDQDW